MAADAGNERKAWVMPWLLAFLIGVAVGMLPGLMAEYTGALPILRSVGSALLGLVFGTVLNVVAFVLLASALHALLGWLPVAVGGHRAIILGVFGGLCGALSIARAMSIASRLP